jgi:RNA polymerase sigma factor (sigma-70 family)
VWRIVLSRAHDLRRKTGQTPQISVRDEFIPVDHDPELAAAVRALPERRRMVVFLRYFAEFSYGEIADTCGMSEGTVGATLSQAHTELRAALTPEGVQP